MRRVVATAIGITSVILSATGRADDGCPVTAAPVIELVLEVLPPDEIIGVTLERHLRSELRERDIDLCARPPKKTPLAQVKLHVDHPAVGPVVATISIRDALTRKHVERSIDLTKLPPETRPLVVATATDELLRASWAELHLVDAPPPSEPPPRQVIEALTTTSRPVARAPRRFEIGAQGELSSFFGHRTGFGGGVVAGWWFVPRAALSVRASATYGLEETAANGRVRADTTSAGIGGALALVPVERAMGARAEVGVQALHASFEGVANPGTTASRGGDWTAVATLGVAGWMSLTKDLRLTLGASMLYALRPIRALDAGESVMAIEGFGGEARLGALVPF
jgi:hypothetical protein